MTTVALARLSLLLSVLSFDVMMFLFMAWLGDRYVRFDEIWY